MREYKETHVYYNKDDCQALQDMTLGEIAGILEGIEGTWMPGRPNEYYSLMNGARQEAEFDFDLLRANIAIDKAARLIRQMAKEQQS